MKDIKFSTSHGKDFSAELRQKVSEYFVDNKKTKYGGRPMIVKSLVMLSLFILPMIILNLGLSSHWTHIVFLYLISGIGMAGIGMGIMHDALHGSYSSKKRINELMGYSINLIGANATTWKIQHNVLHHTYTNVNEFDDDLTTPGILRFSPDRELRSAHRFQHIYAWFFYSLVTLVWVTTRDFVRMNQYRSMGFLKDDLVYRKEIIKSIFWKIAYFSYALIIPVISNSAAWWVVPLAFLLMHMVTGTILSFVFQTAHIVPSSTFPKPNREGLIDNQWLYHQLDTTSNYAPNSKIFSWFIGGLNYQVEHHLLPHVSHVHYKGLSQVVRPLVEKYNLPYHSKENFFTAIAAHAAMLKSLGTPDQ